MACLKITSKRWREANRGACRAMSRKWRTENPEGMREARRKSYVKHRDAAIKRALAWVSTNREAARGLWRLRRARKRAAKIEKFSKAEWLAVVEAYGGLCAYCRIRPWSHQDHVVPLSRGGAHSIANVVPACGPCNQRKYAATWQPCDVGNVNQHPVQGRLF